MGKETYSRYLFRLLGHTTSGHEATAIPAKPINSRRFMLGPLEPIFGSDPEDYGRPRESVMNAAVRGKIILTSVNSPGCVLTSMDPECCFTMMS